MKDGTAASRGLALGALVPLGFTAALFIAPLVALGLKAFDSSDSVSLWAAWRNADALDLLWTTVLQAGLSALSAVVVAAPIVWLVSTVQFRGAVVFRVLVTLPFVLPTVVVGVAFRALDSGPLAALGLDSGLGAILVAHTFLNVAVVVRVVSAVWQQVDPRAVAAARSLGASPWRAFCDVVLPRLIPAIAAAAALVFLFCSTSFGVILLLGNGQVRTIETEIYQQAVTFFRLPEAVALSLLQILLVIAALLVARWLGRGPEATSDRIGRKTRPRGTQWLTVAAVIAWAFLWLLLPILVLAYRSLRPGGRWGLGGYRALSDNMVSGSVMSSLWYSVTSAVAAMLIAVLIGTLAAVTITRGRGPLATVSGALSILPLGISAVTLGFGYVVLTTYLPRSVGASPLLIPAVQALIAIPIVIGMLVPALGQVPQARREAATVLGAGPFRVFWTVDLPLIARSLASAAGFAFIMAIGEFGATTFLARPATTTLPVMIGTLMNRPGPDNFAAAMAASIILVAVCAAVLIAIEFFVARGQRGPNGDGLLLEGRR